MKLYQTALLVALLAVHAPIAAHADDPVTDPGAGDGTADPGGAPVNGGDQPDYDPVIAQSGVPVAAGSGSSSSSFVGRSDRDSDFVPGRIILKNGKLIKVAP